MTPPTTTDPAIILPNPADLAGHKTLPIDIGRLLLLMRWLEEADTQYLMGAKPDEPRGGTPFAWPPSFHDEAGRSVNAVDCSGFGRYAIWFLTHGQVVIPDGTSAQFDWFHAQDFKEDVHDQYDAVGGLHDGHLRVNICTSEDGHAYGHFWFTYGGLTDESWGGHGPGSRAFNAAVLERIVRKVFVIY